MNDLHIPAILFLNVQYNMVEVCTGFALVFHVARKVDP